MKIVFIGASELGYNCCEYCITNRHSIVGIITLGNEFTIKYKEQKERQTVKNFLFKDFKDFEQKYNVPVVVAQQPISDCYKVIESWQPDLIIVIGWYYMIPKKIMDLPPKGVIGIHASLLPKYRGNAPLVWAMINGEKETGVSLFYIEQGTDEGDLIGQRSITIEDDDSIAEVLQKAGESSKALLLQYLPLLATDSAPRIKQDHTQSTYFPKRSPEDGLIDWTWDPKRIKNFIKAQSKPYPGAFTIMNGKKVTIWDADVESNLDQ